MKRLSILIAVLVLGVLSPVSSVRATDGGGAWATYGAYFTKEYVLDTAARAAAQAIYQRMIDEIANTISTAGPNGTPAWIQNWRKFFRKSQDTGRDIFAWQLYDAALGDRATICKYLADPLADALGAAYNSDFSGRSNEIFRYGTALPFNLRTRCPFPEDFDLEAYRNDWSFDSDTFIKMIESGDYYTILSMAYDEQQRQIEAEFDTTKSEGISGGGYQSIKKDGTIVTPGSIFSIVQAATITKELDWLISTDELSELISSATSLVVNRLIDYAESTIVDDSPDAREPAAAEEKIPISNARLCRDICDARARATCDVDQPMICETQTQTNTDPTTGEGSTSGTEVCRPVTNEECRNVEAAQCRIDMQCR